MNIFHLAYEFCKMVHSKITGHNTEVFRLCHQKRFILRLFLTIMTLEWLFPLGRVTQISEKNQTAYILANPLVLLAISIETPTYQQYKGFLQTTSQRFFVNNKCTILTNEKQMA
jgi:hypothetical protein